MVNRDSILLNTDVLLHAADSSSRLHLHALNVREMAAKSDIKGCVSMSVLSELLVALTSDWHVRSPISTSDAIGEYEKYINLKPINKIINLMSSYKTINNLVRDYNLKGTDIKLAELVATMLDNRVYKLCTFQQEEYERFSEIEVLNPFEFDNRQTNIQFGE